MTRLIVKSFGPIKELEISIKEVNVFIGTTGSGKSVAGKLIAIFRHRNFIVNPELEVFKNLLKEFNIGFPITYSTEISFYDGRYNWVVRHSVVSTNFPLKDFAFSLYSIEKNSPKIEMPKTKPTFLRDINCYLSLEKDELKKMLEVLGTTTQSDQDFARTIQELLDLKETIQYRPDVPEDLSNVVSNIQKIQQLMEPFIEFVKKEYRPYHINYIAAERILLSMISASKFGLDKNDIALPDCFLNFATDFENARRNIVKSEIPFLDIVYEYREDKNFVRMKDGVEVNLEQASSGIQSIIPLLMVISHKPKEHFLNRLVVIEEPELNLYPTAQKAIAETIIQTTLQNKDNLIITTHSPYVLTAIDNLIVANNTVVSKPDREVEVNKIVPREFWLDFENISCYYFDEGTATDILNYDLRTIKANAIDDVSEKISQVHGDLLAIQYH